MKRKQPTRQDLLERFVSLGVTAKDFEKEHGLPRNLIGKMKQGDYSTAKETHRRFEEALIKAEAARVPVAAKGKAKPSQPTAPAPASPSSSVPEAPAPRGRPREKVADDVEAELLGRIRGKEKTAEEWDALLRYILELAALGKISTEFARFCNDAISNGRQLSKTRAEEEEKARGDTKLEIEVKNVAAWQAGGTCPYCSGTGKLDANSEPPS